MRTFLAGLLFEQLFSKAGRTVRLTEEIGRAVQYFYAADEDYHYRMEATFFRAEFVDGPSEIAEHEPRLMPIEDVINSFFHQCHAWAINQAAR